MLVDVFKQFNYLDIVILIILFRICYIALKMGLAIEFFKLSGVLCAIYIASHYYITLTDIIRNHYFPKVMPLKFMDFITFLILAALTNLGFVFLRSIFYRFMKMEAAPKINKFGALFFGLARGYFSIGLLIYVLMISSVSYLNNSVKHSYLGSRASLISAQTYRWLWDSIFSKFSPQERPNLVVNEASGNLISK